MSATISTHVLDTARGMPAAGLPVRLERLDLALRAAPVGSSRTDADGRASTLLDEGERLAPGHYRLVFETDAYFSAQGTTAFYPRVSVDFIVRDDAHHHVPLLLSPFGYTTYRGS